MTNSSVSRKTAAPFTNTRLFDVVTVTVPPCGHIRTLSVVNNPPTASLLCCFAITSLPEHRRLRSPARCLPERSSIPASA